MKKTTIRIICMLTILGILVGTAPTTIAPLSMAAPTVVTPSPAAASGITPAAVTLAENADTEFRGIWVATVLNLDYPSKKGIDVAAMKQEADTILTNVADLGYNAVILQVRPTADAFYKSNYFPWSNYLTGSQGVAPSDGFDPLTYWVEQAHARNMTLHAWINPFRITQGSAASPQHDVTTLAATHPARKNPSWTVAHTDGKLYFNPGLPEVRKLVIDGVTEIVQNYDVDGIQFDDYFYPGEAFNDDAAYKTYGAGYSNKADWRRDNVNALIRDTYAAIKAVDKTVTFGVSPIGIWANKSNSQYGSDTRGNESYYAQYADTRKWVKSGWLDYIAPQIYWNIGFGVADYAKLVPWWSDVVKGTAVKLYIGQAIYRVGEGKNAGDAWYGADEIARQDAFNGGYEQVTGVIHFRYNFLVTNEALRNTVAKTFDTTTPAPPVTTPTPSPNNAALTVTLPNTKVLSVGRPTASTATTNASSYYILGTADPSKPLYMNGTLVESRAPDGYFGVLAKLNTGANAFTFTQTGQTSVTTTITYKVATAAGPSKMTKAEIVEGSVFPKTAHEYRQPGETVTLSCTAPIGATVTVAIGGSTYTMTPGTKTVPSGGGLYSTVFTYNYKMPASTATGKLITIGTPKYTMTLDAASSTRTAGGSLISITEKAPYYATLKADTAFVYSGSTTTGGPKNELAKDQKDYVTAVAGNGAWVRLRIGGWVQAADVTLTTEKTDFSAALSEIKYTVGKSLDTLTMSVKEIPATDLAFDGKVLTFKLTGVSAVSKITLPKGSLFSAVEAAYNAGTTTYTMTLAENTQLDGYYVTTDAGKLTLNLKRHPKITAGDKPLTGLTILLDPGHGSSDPGAIGPLGTAFAEKHVNLTVSLKLKAALEAKGATVKMTRIDDSNPSLNDRVMISRNLRPDLFLSIHANSVAESTDSTTIRGLETYYRNLLGKPISDLVRNTVVEELAYGNRSSKQANLYVIRPTWTPSALVETGFMCNVEDFARLSADADQTKMVNSITAAVVKFFS